MKKLGFLASFFLFAVSAEAQSLDRLKERAAAFWTERVADNQPAYLKFVEPSGANAFRSSQQPRYLSADLAAIEFGVQSNTATVVTKVRLMLPELGEVKREIRDSWVWNGKNWFLRPQEVTLASIMSTASAPGEASKTEPPLTFVPSPSQINLGKHVQGEVVSAQLSFKTDRDRIAQLLPGDLPGVTYGPIEWKDNQTGSIEFTVDTTMMSEDLVKPLIFRIVDERGQEILKPVPLLVQIEGRVRITQDPPVVDPSQSGTVELSLLNLTDKPIRITTVTSNNESFVLDPEVKVNVGPQETTKIKLTYRGSNSIGGASVAVRFAESVLGRTSVGIPIQVKEQRTSRPSMMPQLTPQQIEEIRRQNPVPKPPPAK
jgi:hypothetical protein